LRLNALVPPPSVSFANGAEALTDVISSAYLLLHGARNVLKETLLSAHDAHGQCSNGPSCLAVGCEAGQVSQIDDEAVNRLRAANENVACSGLFEWLRSVNDLPRNQTTLTAVTNAGPARPTDRDVARLGQLQNALVGRGFPVCCDAA